MTGRREIVAEGTWCRECEFFEVPDMDDGRCMACGCAENRHVEVEVVTINSDTAELRDQFAHQDETRAAAVREVADEL